MTKKLEEIFDLEPKQTEDTKIDVSEPLPVKADIPTETLSNIEKIENALPRVKGLEAGDSEMDELAEIAQRWADQCTWDHDGEKVFCWQLLKIDLWILTTFF